MAVTDTTIRFATSSDATTIFNFIQALAIYEREPDAVEATPASISEQPVSYTHLTLPTKA